MVQKHGLFSSGPRLLPAFPSLQGVFSWPAWLSSRKCAQVHPAFTVEPAIPNGCAGIRRAGVSVSVELMETCPGDCLVNKRDLADIRDGTFRVTFSLNP